MRRADGRGRARLLALAILLAAGAAAGQTAAPTPAGGPAPVSAAPAPVGGAVAAADPSPSAPALRTRAVAARPGAPALPAPTTAAFAAGPDVLRGVGGDTAPVCRAGCAPAFYACASGAGADGSCHAALTTCRRACDAQEPAVGRLQSPLPTAGLAAAGPLRPLPGSLPPLR